MKKIAIDGYPITEVKGGIGYYIDETLIELYKHDIEIVVFVPSGVKIKNQNLKNSDKIKIVRILHPLKSEIIWSIFTVPLFLLLYKPDLFLGLSQYVPIFKIPGVSYILCIHDFAYHLTPRSLRVYRRYFLKFLMPRFVSNADILLFNSLGTLDKFKEFFPMHFESKKHLLLRPPIRNIDSRNIVDQTIDKNLYDLLSDKKSFVFVLAPLEPRKNIPLLLYSYSSYLDQNNPGHCHSLVLAGSSGWKSKGSINALSYLKSRHPSKFTKLDFIDDSLYAFLLKNCSGFLVLSEYEGYGMPVTEALQFQKNVYYTNIPELNEASFGNGTPIDLNSIGSYMHEIFSTSQKQVNTRLFKPISNHFADDILVLANYIKSNTYASGSYD